jgi:three-Cys-motif partner protein
MVILSQGKFPEILYIDGFAGPGEYSGGEPGSPILALDTALGYQPPLAARVHFLFVEQDRGRADNLESLIRARTLPANFDVVVEGGVDFESAFERNRQRYLRRARLMPTFAFIDPFGWKGVPFRIIENILQHSSCEVFVNFMYEEINRFLTHPDQVTNFDIFFGTQDWRDSISGLDPRARNQRLHELYRCQLERAATYVRSFEMSNKKDVTDYYLFYATNELLGLKKMKEAMWKADESGEFRFSDATDANQMVLFESKPDLQALRKQITAEFAGRTAKVSDIEHFVLLRTAFRETHFKGVLKQLELEGSLEAIDPPPKRKRGTFADHVLVLRFHQRGGCADSSAVP